MKLNPWATSVVMVRAEHEEGERAVASDEASFLFCEGMR
jgi:hypothetical protein